VSTSFQFPLGWEANNRTEQTHSISTMLGESLTIKMPIGRDLAP
jgi:hypothetical protein